MARKLIDIEIEEVSLVDAAANKSKFAIIKRRQEMDELEKLLKSLLGDEYIEKSVEKQELPPEQVKAVAGALAILNKYKADFPADILGAIKSLAKYVAAPAAPAVPLEAKKSEDMSNDDIAKVGARLSKATLEELRKISEALDGIDLKAIKTVKGLVDGMIQSGAPVPEGETMKYKGLPDDIRARLMKLDEEEAARAAEANVKKTADLIKSAVAEALKPFEDKIDKLEKSKGVSKSAKGQVKDGETDADSPKWPSLAMK